MRLDNTPDTVPHPLGIEIPRKSKFTECSTLKLVYPPKAVSVGIHYSSLCVETHPCFIGQVEHVKELMKYVPVTQNKVCKQSVTVRWHLLPPNSSQSQPLLHSLCLSVSVSPTLGLPPASGLNLLTSLLYPSHSSKYKGAKVHWCCSFISFTLLVCL